MICEWHHGGITDSGHPNGPEPATKPSWPACCFIAINKRLEALFDGAVNVGHNQQADTNSDNKYGHERL